MNHTILTRDQVRRVDQLAAETLGMPTIILMENAARGVVRAVLGELERREIAVKGTHVAILCGGGNNGGDGYAAARLLHNAGARVRLLATKPPDDLEGDAATNAKIARAMGLGIRLVNAVDDVAEQTRDLDVCKVIVDALLGTGFHGEVRSPMAELIQRANDAKSWGASIVAVDVPSGLDCDTGEPANVCVQADVTATFVASKPGFQNPSGARYVGKVIVVDIGTPPELIERARAEA